MERRPTKVAAVAIERIVWVIMAMATDTGSAKIDNSNTPIGESMPT